MLGGSNKSMIYNDLQPIETIKIHDSGVAVRKGDLEGRRRLLVDYRSGDVWSPFIPRGEALRNVCEHFIDCVDHGRTPLSDGEFGLRIVRILDAAQRSIRAQGGRITL
jgi:predicted dehydrogenase